MKLVKLQLENYRSYASFEHNFLDDQPHLIIHGQNGRGKTNILEAIYLLSLGRSFRSSNLDHLIQWNSEYFRVKGQYFDDDNGELEAFYTTTPRRRKNFKINGVSYKHSSFVGHLPTVLFQPDDLNLIYQTPTLRRRYLNILLSQSNRGYLEDLINYQKILKQRNALLHTMRETRIKNGNTGFLADDLTVWDQELAIFGARIIKRRLEFAKFVNQQLQERYCRISGGNEQLAANYQPKLRDCQPEDTISDLQTKFTQELLFRREKDLLIGVTTCGPHRDELQFFLNANEMSSSASRGEVRSLILALKLLEIDFIESRKGTRPLLLLDDVFSELDESRQHHLVTAIGNCQSIITTTDNFRPLDDMSLMEL